MNDIDRADLERVIPGPEYPEIRRRSQVATADTIAAVLIIVIAVLVIVSAASQRPAETSDTQSPAEPAAEAGRVARPASGTPHDIREAVEDSGAPPTSDRYRGTATGQASWYDVGGGLYGAVHSWRWGDDPYWVEVCRQDASATCVLVVVRDHMANKRRAIDLSPDAFVRLWPGLSRRAALGRGVVDVTVRPTGASATLPPTHEEAP